MPILHRRQILAACAGLLTLPTRVLAESPRSRPVIFHTDIGYDVDDTWALLLLMRSPELDLKLVVTDVSNTTYRARVAAKLLMLGGHERDISKITMAIGPKAGDEPGPQSDWVGDFTLKDFAGPVRMDAAQAIIDVILASDVPVTLISTGPATLIAEALKREPKIAGHARFVAMDGAIRMGYDGAHTPVAEYNVKTDPAALRTVFAAPWDCTITPLDTCGTFVLDGSDYQKVRQSRDPFAQAVIRNSEIWLPHAPWMPKGFDLTRTSSTLFDAVAVVMAYDERNLVMETLPLSVWDDGMTVIDPLKGRLVRCATAWRDMAAVKRDIVARLTGS